jgi:protein-disulfide isomerase
MWEETAMADSNNKASKRRTRADRRAAEEALERARAEEAARERRQQTTIGIIVVGIIVALIAAIGITVYVTHHKNAQTNVTADSAYSQLQKVATKPAKADDKGGILISKDGYGKKVSGAPTIAIYMDPLCPGCGNFNRQVDPTLKAMMDAGQVNLDLHPMAFMDQLSTDSYSSRAAGAMAYIADHDSDPNHLLQYISNIYAQDFQPEEGTSNYKPVSDAKLKEQAVKAGVPEKIAAKAFGGEYKPWLEAIDTYTPKRKDLWNVSGQSKGTMTTPTVTINGKMLDMNQVSTLGLSLKQAILTSLGLQESQIGKSGAMPTIGASGKPVSLSSGA